MSKELKKQMIGIEDSPLTFEYAEHYKILPAIHGWSEDKKRIGTGKKVPENFIYDSYSNKKYMSSEELKIWIKENINEN